MHEPTALLADIGGTNFRCALTDPSGHVVAAGRFRVADHPTIADALEAFIAGTGLPRPAAAALSVAAPVTGDEVAMVNIERRFSQRDLAHRLGLGRLVVVNDFVALAWSMTRLGDDDRIRIGGGEPAERAARAVLGPGTGLGTSALVPCGEGWTAVPAEGGHMTLAAYDEREEAVIRHTRRRYGHCSAERLLSGPGLTTLYGALAAIDGEPDPALDPAEVTRRAGDGEPRAAETLDLFFAMLGTVAANLALALGARGGVYLAGGILPRLADALRASRFRERFEDKGRYRSYLAPIPAYLITAGDPAFAGLTAILLAGDGRSVPGGAAPQRPGA